MEGCYKGIIVDQRKDGRKLSILSLIPALLSVPMMFFLVWCMFSGKDWEWREKVSIIMTILTTLVVFVGFAMSFLIAMITTISRRYRVHPVSWVAVGVNAFTGLSFLILVFPIAVFGSAIFLFEMSPYSQKGGTLKYLKNRYEEVIGIGKYKDELGVISPDGEDLGNPPNIAACFIKDMPADISMNEEEYVRRRELLEGAGK